MATRSFDLNTEPHVATVGPHTFRFIPEATGAKFLSAHAALKDAQARVQAAGDDASADDLLAVNSAARDFLRGFMLVESASAFDTVELPDRVVVQLIEWLAGVYGGGSGNDQATSSGAA